MLCLTGLWGMIGKKIIVVRCCHDCAKNNSSKLVTHRGLFLSLSRITFIQSSNLWCFGEATQDSRMYNGAFTSDVACALNLRSSPLFWCASDLLLIAWTSLPWSNGHFFLEFMCCHITENKDNVEQVAWVYMFYTEAPASTLLCLGLPDLSVSLRVLCTSLVQR